MAGISEDMLHRYIRGDSRPSFGAMALLCAAGGVTMEWLATGEEPEKDAPVTGAALSKIDLALLTDVIRLIEDWLSNADRKMSPSKKAEVIVMAYEMIEERPTGTSQESYHNNVVRLLRVAS
ncbi:MAG: helix-turn-helix transcriptional regulator [Alphaproteobacteria bacterium]|nr:helix-turn-helix transcriptional regulator [Alphaproteobacteria bacterium]